MKPIQDTALEARTSFLLTRLTQHIESEAKRGDEFLLRHIIRIVAEALAEAKHPEAKEALELQNRLIAEAIRIHDHSVTKR